MEGKEAPWILLAAVVSVVSLQFICLTVEAAEDCQIHNDDFCRCSAGSLTLDLREIGLSFPVSANDAGNDYSYTYTPCTPQVCGNSGGAASVLCQLNLDNNASYAIGRYTPFNWTITMQSPLQFILMYGGGDEANGKPRSGVVEFLSEGGTTKFTYANEGENLDYYFNVVGSGVAPVKRKGKAQAEDISGPIGISIIVLALLGFVIYFILGGLFLYYKRGARGKEVIPNYAFWKDLPFLLKDGLLFTISPCYKRQSNKYSGL